MSAPSTVFTVCDPLHLHILPRTQGASPGFRVAMMPRPDFAMLFVRISSLAFLALPALAQTDAGVSKALEGLPAEVLPHVRLAPETSLHSMDAEDPLAAAVHFASVMTGDDELRNRCLMRAGEAAIMRGRTGLAREVVSKITDHRAAVLLSSLAEAAGASDVKRATEWWELAAQMAKLVKPAAVDEVASRLVVSGHALRLPPQRIAPWFQAITDPWARFSTGTEVTAVTAAREGSFDLLAYRQERQNLKRGLPAPGLLQAARRLLASAAGQKTSPDRARQFVEAAQEILADSHVVHAELVVEAATQLFDAGFEDLARDAMNAVQGQFGGPPDEVARLHARMAMLWQKRGLAPRMHDLLTQGEQQARTLEKMHQPFCLAWYGMAWRQVGDETRGSVLLVQAAESAWNHPNPRIQRLGAFEISLCHAILSQSLPPNVAKVLHQIDGRK